MMKGSKYNMRCIQVIKLRNTKEEAWTILKPVSQQLMSSQHVATLASWLRWWIFPEFWSGMFRESVIPLHFPAQNDTSKKHYIQRHCENWLWNPVCTGNKGESRPCCNARTRTHAHTHTALSLFFYSMCYTATNSFHDHLQWLLL